MSDEGMSRVLYAVPLSEKPELPVFPLSAEERVKLFEILAGYSAAPLPEWAVRIGIARLVGVPPWELHRCPPEWLKAAIELGQLEAEASEYRAMKAERRRAG